MRKRAVLAIAAVAATAAFVTAQVVHTDHPTATAAHQNVTATMFWVGEPPKADNAKIPNDTSAWDSQWQQHFGGLDDPYHRQNNGYWPAGFRPKENPFYFALPYAEFTDKGQVKADAKKIPWYNPLYPPTASYSILKNHWIRIIAHGKVAFAQWEDVGPMYTDDLAYVFGTAAPQYGSGLDLSPAATYYLGLNGQERVSWEFVDASEVPSGPWKDIPTTSQITR